MKKLPCLQKEFTIIVFLWKRYKKSDFIDVKVLRVYRKELRHPVLNRETSVFFNQKREPNT